MDSLDHLINDMTVGVGWRRASHTETYFAQSWRNESDSWNGPDI
jgi:hypothetical protein